MRRRIVPGFSLLSWLYLSALAWLSAWVLAVHLIIGWSAFAVVSSSMSPSVVPGDLVMSSPLGSAAPQGGEVITFHPPGGGNSTVTHRVVEVLSNGSVVTKGDASAKPDPIPVPRKDIIGVGRLVVPELGLPRDWITNHDYLPLFLWIGGSLAALGFAIAGSSSTMARRYRQGLQRFTWGNERGRSRTWRVWQQLRGQTSGKKAQEVVSSSGKLAAVDTALRRLRALAGGVVLLQTFAHRGSALSPVLSITASQLAIAVIVGVTGVNLISTAGSKSQSKIVRKWLTAVELAIDVALVVGLATVLSVFTADVTWALLVVPLLEAALRYRLRGAIFTWFALAIVYPLGYVWSTTAMQGGVAHGAALVSMQSATSRLGVVLLVAIPAGFLSERLLSEIEAHRSARDMSVRRSEVLATVASASQDVSHLERDPLESILSGVLQLGFSTAEIARGDGTPLARSGVPLLPSSSSPVLARIPDAPDDSVVLMDISSSDSDDELAFLDEHDLSGLAWVRLGTDRDDLRLRAGTPSSDQVTLSQLEGLQLLAGQASVAIRNQQLLSELRTAHQQLEHEAFHDALTSLPNRANFRRSLELALAETPDEVALLFCDLDRFKPVNDELGHDAGDLLLVSVAGRLRACAGEGNMVSRLGGDEFTVIVRGRSAAAKAEAIAAKICDALNRPFQLSVGTVQVSTSVGVALGDPGTTATDLLRRADTAMYAAKAAGRARWQFWDENLDRDEEMGHASRRRGGRAEVR